MKLIFTLLLHFGSLSLILAQVNLSNGLVLCLPFDGNANDNKASFLTGTVNNAVLIENRFGKGNSAYAFNGIDAYIMLPHSEIYNFGSSDAFTISIWVKQAILQNDLGNHDNDVMSKWINATGGTEGYTGGYPFVMRIHNQQRAGTTYGLSAFGRWDGSGNLGGCESGGGVSSFSSPGQEDSTFNDNEWHHYVFRKLAANGFLSLTIDGVDYGLQDDDSGDGGGGCTTLNNAPLYIGTRSPLGNFFTGALDDIQIWNRDLTDEEVQALWVGSSTSVEEFQNQLAVFPNPTRAHLRIEGEPQHLYRYELFSTNGQQVASGPIFDQQISLTDLPISLYLLRVYGRNGELSYVGKVEKA
ncbi:MAG: LamG domain-containing protein [Bacteroidota bacterium]